MHQSKNGTFSHIKIVFDQKQNSVFFYQNGSMLDELKFEKRLEHTRFVIGLQPGDSLQIY